MSFCRFQGPALGKRSGAERRRAQRAARRVPRRSWEAFGEIRTIHTLAFYGLNHPFFVLDVEDWFMGLS